MGRRKRGRGPVPTIGPRWPPLSVEPLAITVGTRRSRPICGVKISAAAHAWASPTRPARGRHATRSGAAGPARPRPERRERRAWRPPSPPGAARAQGVASALAARSGASAGRGVRPRRPERRERRAWRPPSPPGAARAQGVASALAARSPRIPRRTTGARIAPARSRPGPARARLDSADAVEACGVRHTVADRVPGRLLVLLGIPRSRGPGGRGWTPPTAAAHASDRCWPTPPTAAATPPTAAAHASDRCCPRLRPLLPRVSHSRPPLAR